NRVERDANGDRASPLSEIASAGVVRDACAVVRLADEELRINELAEVVALHVRHANAGDRPLDLVAVRRTKGRDGRLVAARACASEVEVVRARDVCRPLFEITNELVARDQDAWPRGARGLPDVAGHGRAL